ncbi:hypothetical protein BU24DRAFT_420319 [Aaosphaeria arxii CBS 175.79]|uniref:Uncharacterized protein n=1 Tax=Aaosphaeria arxii CBS 175.79 TaxID=1450172 RepID=A0A6A5XWC6_9PLEO|nr:uncharacterized protein BU24DRAFT_420319 [Aaosphaeria arxii CBS 175.79]KAF2017279.1 hypothetical protein BU24DRAFT_420319 [Aaosphaeria arxii CBS 175.79]
MPPKRDIRDFFKPNPESPLVANPAPSHSPGGTANPFTLNVKGDESSIDRKPLPHQTTNPNERTSTAENDFSTIPNGVPPTSQTSFNSTGSKRRISASGEEIILDSDSGSSSDELEELDLSFLRNAPTSRDEDNSKTTKKSESTPITRSAMYARSRDDELRKPSEKYTMPKPTLSRLIQAAHNDFEKELKIAAGREEVSRPLEEEVTSNIEFSEETLATIAHEGGDDEKSKRLYLAMQRTNAHDTACVFHLFLEQPVRSRRSEPFPYKYISAYSWAASFQDPWERQHAFLSGYAQRIFQYTTLPQELAAWLIDQLSLERDDVLKDKYLLLLEAHPHHLESLLSPKQLNHIFERIGTTLDFSDPSQELPTSYESQESPARPIPSSLRWILRLLQVCSRWLSPESSGHALLILIHACFDDSVMSDATILQNVQDAIESLMCSILELTPILADIVPLLLLRITNPILQSNCILSLPGNSPLTASFRRHLALAFLLNPTPLNIPLSHPELPKLIHSHLDTSKDFVADRHSDYTALAARLILLDIGIGPGLIEVPFPRPPESLQETPLVPKQSTLTMEETAFNKHVDALARHVKIISNSIIETGALSDPARSDAKSSAEKLYHRLGNAVRIGGRKKELIFGGDEEEGSRRIMGRFFNWVRTSESTTPQTPEDEGSTTIVDGQGQSS